LEGEIEKKIQLKKKPKNESSQPDLTYGISDLDHEIEITS
jgi:hypothetical protein